MASPLPSAPKSSLAQRAAAFLAAHPKSAVIAAAVAGNLVGVVFRI